MNCPIYIVIVMTVVLIIPVDNKRYTINTNSGDCFEMKIPYDKLENKFMLLISYQVIDVPHQWVDLKVSICCFLILNNLKEFFFYIYVCSGLSTENFNLLLLNLLISILFICFDLL